MISAHITYEEATKSQTAIRKGIDNTPSPEALRNMFHIAEKIFEPIRTFIGGPLAVSSFYRSPRLNKAIGGSTSSQHCKGEAMDLDADIFGNSTNNDIFDYIRENLEFDQLIGEGMSESGEFAWVHVSLKRNNENRGEVLLMKRTSKGVKYYPYKPEDHE